MFVFHGEAENRIGRRGELPMADPHQSGRGLLEALVVDVDCHLGFHDFGRWVVVADRCHPDYLYSERAMNLRER